MNSDNIVNIFLILIIALGVIFISPKWLLLILALSVIIGVGFLIIAYLINRISNKVLITKASIKSRSIITANLAVEQGKDVYAIPGNITYKQSEGTNLLIKDGAFLVTRLEDIANI